MDMKIPQPRLAVRLLPFMDITFILLAFFMIMPHGSFEKKTSKTPQVKKLKETAQDIEVSPDLPVYIQIGSDKKVKIKAQSSSFKWDFHTFDFAKIGRNAENFRREYQKFLTKLTEVLKSQEKRRALREERWERSKSKGSRYGRAPQVFIQVEIHKYAAIRLPLWIVSHLEKYVQQHPQSSFALRRVE